MPIATPQGTLDFKSVDTVTFVGASSNTVIDTTTGSLGVGVDGNGPTSNLHVVGHTRLEGDINMLHTANTASIKLNSNVVTEFPRSKKLIKYPRVAIANGNTMASGAGVQTPGLSGSQDGFVATSSSNWGGGGADSRAAWCAFDEGTSSTTYKIWQSGNYYTTATPGVYNRTPPQSHTADGVNYEGEWIKLELPHKINVSTIEINSAAYGTLTGHHTARPYEGAILGSNNDTNWSLLKSFSGGLSWTTTTVAEGGSRATLTPDANTTNYYKYLMLVVNKNQGSRVSVDINEIRYYGVPEYDPDADGVDVVVKSLPNVPNTDWLEVYYDAKNYSGSGDVQDETTNDRDAEMNATFDNGEIKAFSFSGAHTSNVTTSDHGLGTGDVPYTVSYWFKRIQQRNSYDYLYIMGNGGSIGQASLMWILNDRLYLDHWSTNTRYNEPIQNNRWYHVAAGHRGGEAVTNDFLFIDGQNAGVSVSTPQTFNLQGSKLTLGTSHNSTNEFLEGSIANFRVFNRALTQDEIYQLYAYQKEYFGHGDLNMTLKAGRLGIGTSEPKAALDVRGNLRASGLTVQTVSSTKTDTFSTTGGSSHPVSPGNDVPGLAVTIHPKFANSRILVSYTVSTGAYGRAYLRIQRKQGGSTTTIAPSVGPEANTQNQGKCTTSHSGSGDSSVDSQSFEYYDTIGGTEPITYQIQAWTYHSTYYIYVNRGHDDGNGSNNGTYWARTLSSITAKEVCQ